MNIRIARRLAAWLKQASSAKKDLMFRLSVLEGAAGLPQSKWGSWSLNPSRGLREATDAFSGTSLDPTWLTRSDTKFYDGLLDKVEAVLRSSKIQDVTDLTPTDIVNDGLFGLNRYGKLTRKPIPPDVGAKLADGIKSGSETPKTALKMARYFYQNKAVDEIKAYRRRADRYRQDVSGEGAVEDRGIADVDPEAHERSKLQLFADLFYDDSHPLGRKIQGWVRDYLEKQRGAKYLLHWFEESLKKGEPVEYRQVAEDLGVRPEGLGKYFSPIFGNIRKGTTGKLYEDFWKSSVARELEDEVEEMQQRLRQASKQKRVAKIARCWIRRLARA